MAFSADIKTIFDADNGAGGVATLLTGGIYTFDSLGRNGISRETTPTAFNGTLLKPCAVIKDRAQTPDSGVMDDDLQIMSYRQVVEVWLYNNGGSSGGYGILEQVAARIFLLLHGNPVGSNKNIARWTGTPWSMKEPEMENAVFIRTEYEFRGLLAAS